MITDEHVNEIWATASRQFFITEGEHICSGVSERNLCGRLALYLQTTINLRGLERYYVDVEFNKKQGGKIKTIINGQAKIVEITCDLILHLRGEKVENDNLIAIEMKKASRLKSEKLDDKDRLVALTKNSYNDIWSYDGVTHPEHVCGYRLGVYLELNPKRRRAQLEYYRSGKHSNSEDVHFA